MDNVARIAGETEYACFGRRGFPRRTRSMSYAMNNATTRHRRGIAREVRAMKRRNGQVGKGRIQMERDEKGSIEGTYRRDLEKGSIEGPREGIYRRDLEKGPREEPIERT